MLLVLQGCRVFVWMRCCGFPIECVKSYTMCHFHRNQSATHESQESRQPKSRRQGSRGTHRQTGHGALSLTAQPLTDTPRGRVCAQSLTHSSIITTFSMCLFVQLITLLNGLSDAFH